MLSRESGYSRAHFARSFHATTGMTVHRYVLERRAQKAQHLLGINGGRHNFAEVAAMVGFYSHSHINGAFLRGLWGTPTEIWRRGLSKSDEPNCSAWNS